MCAKHCERKDSDLKSDKTAPRRLFEGMSAAPDGLLKNAKAPCNYLDANLAVAHLSISHLVIDPRGKIKFSATDYCRQSENVIFIDFL